MSRKWTAKLIIKFLEGYENNPCLWDVHNQGYKNRDDRESAYENLSELMEIDGFGIAHVKAKIRSIRNAYALEIAKIKKSQYGLNEEYVPKVPWFPTAHRILREVVQIRETTTAIKTETQPESMDSDEETQPTVAVLPPSRRDRPVAKKPGPRKLTLNTAPKRATKRIQRNSTEKALEELQEIAKKLEEKPSKEDDEFVCFGKSVACQLKKLPESVALRSMAYIQSYLVQQRLQSKLGKSTEQSSSVTSPATTSNYEPDTAPDANTFNLFKQ